MLLLQYDGTDFHGYQTQLGVRTVQQAVQEALETMTSAPVSLRASSRTDAGVHARGLPAMFQTRATIPVHGFVRGVNGLLADDVSVVAGAEVDEDFDVRRSASGKTYRYTIWNQRERSALMHRTAWHVRRELDPEAMQRAAAPLVGTHDFAAFRATGCQSKTTIRELTRVAVEPQGPRIEITVEGNAFLQHMVRIIVGTLCEVGRGFYDESFPARALRSGRREQAGPTAPAKGLLLDRVRYDPSPFEN